MEQAELRTVTAAQQLSALSRTIHRNTTAHRVWTGRRYRRQVTLGTLTLGLLTLVLGGACKKPPQPQATSDRPNVLWIVWDTVRADHLSLYGYDKPTTPRLDEWAKGARVFENCISTATSTVPSHASMFTGLMPSEHGTFTGHRFLADGYQTMAELLGDHGYQTYLFAANPHISSEENFQQGFDVEEHPWSPHHRDQAIQILQDKLLPGDTSALARKIRKGKGTEWSVKACGAVAQQGLQAWLEKRDRDRPYFAFLNYMEAHEPLIPAESYRRLMMKAEDVERSCDLSPSWSGIWQFSFGLIDHTDDELAVMAATYDATLAELDDLFHDLIASLEANGDLTNTIIVLTADHGEQLGEHHMFDHQFSLFNPTIHVPLIVHFPSRITPGRDPRPVMNFDLFPTLLDLVGLEIPAGLNSSARSLLAPLDERVRIAEYPAVFTKPFRSVRKKYPNWDPTPWQRTMRAVFSGDDKYIWASDGRHQLYNLADDPGELHDLSAIETDRVAELDAQLARRVADFTKPLRAIRTAPVSQAHRERLEGLGYAGDDEDPDDEPDKTADPGED